MIRPERGGAIGDAPAYGRTVRRGQRPRDEVHRITAAPRPHSDDLDARMSRYLTSMAIRTACVLLVVVVHGPLRWVFAVGAVGLPYIAVVMANAHRTRRDSDPLPPPARGAVGAAPGDPAPRPDSSE